MCFQALSACVLPYPWVRDKLHPHIVEDLNMMLYSALPEHEGRISWHSPHFDYFHASLGRSLSTVVIHIINKQVMKMRTSWDIAPCSFVGVD
jgi:hypothetical protein